MRPSADAICLVFAQHKLELWPLLFSPPRLEGIRLEAVFASDLDGLLTQDIHTTFLRSLRSDYCNTKTTILVMQRVVTPVLRNLLINLAIIRCANALCIPQKARCSEWFAYKCVYVCFRLH